MRPFFLTPRSANRLFVSALAANILVGCAGEADTPSIGGAGAAGDTTLGSAGSGAFAGADGTAGALPVAGATAPPTAGAGSPGVVAGATGQDAAGAAGTGAMDMAAGASAGVSAVERTINYSDVESAVERSCVRSVCHLSPELGWPWPPDLSGLAYPRYDALINTTVEKCGGVPLVDPGHPETSALLMLPQGLCGDLLMPDGCLEVPCIYQSDIDGLRLWIAEGAYNTDI